MVIVGWIVMAVVALISQWISNLVNIKGSHPLEAMMVGIVLGAAARNAGLIPEAWKPVLKKFETPLLWGIVLLGAGFSLKIASELPLSLLVIVITMLVGFFFIYFLGSKLALSQKISALLAVGTTICGGSAIAITSPLIKAKEEETSYAVSTIVIAAFVMLITLPFLGQVLGIPQTAFGIWAGTSVHNTPQTIATGYIFGEEAGQVATMVKLSRNMFMILVAVLVSAWFGAKEASQSGLGKKAILKAFPWVLFGYIAMAVCSVKGYFSPEGIHFFKSAGKFLILMGMVGIGFGTNFMDIKKFGLRPLVTGIIGAVFVTSVSLFLVKILGFF
ncbi:MAG: putative sulfate exporter family transporter [Candidatus Aminicenantes bacterium]|nr:putative sulfate exporter family transporter [Candidatus Aminicenantes bacterium]